MLELDGFKREQQGKFVLANYWTAKETDRLIRFLMQSPSGNDLSAFGHEIGVPSYLLNRFKPESLEIVLVELIKLRDNCLDAIGQWRGKPIDLSELRSNAGNLKSQLGLDE